MELSFPCDRSYLGSIPAFIQIFHYFFFLQLLPVVFNIYDALVRENFFNAFLFGVVFNGDCSFDALGMKEVADHQRMNFEAIKDACIGYHVSVW